MILALLREQTRALHEQAERALDLPTQLRSPASYATLLARFHGFLHPLENRLHGLPGPTQLGLDLTGRRKVPLLRDDLRALGWSPAEIDALPRQGPSPSIANVAAAFGCLYVLEGSTLGGQIIKREVEQRLGFGTHNGCAYFAGYGERTGSMWKSFCAALLNYAETHPDDHAQIVAAASETFMKFEECIAC